VRKDEMEKIRQSFQSLDAVERMSLMRTLARGLSSEEKSGLAQALQDGLDSKAWREWSEDLKSDAYEYVGRWKEAGESSDVVSRLYSVMFGPGEVANDYRDGWRAIQTILHRQGADGSWAYDPDDPASFTIDDEVNQALSKLLKEPVRLSHGQVVMLWRALCAQHDLQLLSPYDDGPEPRFW